MYNVYAAQRETQRGEEDEKDDDSADLNSIHGHCWVGSGLSSTQQDRQ